MPETYEYKIIEGGAAFPSMLWSAFEKTLNDLISEGWEIESSHAASAGITLLGIGPKLVIILRRPKVSE